MLVPVIAWPTTIWPVLQLGLKPIFIDVDLDGDGMYELSDITFELARQKKIIEEVLEHPKLQFRHDGSLGSLPNTKNFVSEVGIISVNIDPNDFKVGWHAMIEPIQD